MCIILSPSDQRPQQHQQPGTASAFAAAAVAVAGARARPASPAPLQLSGSVSSAAATPSRISPPPPPTTRSATALNHHSVSRFRSQAPHRQGRIASTLICRRCRRPARCWTAPYRIATTVDHHAMGHYAAADTPALAALAASAAPAHRPSRRHIGGDWRRRPLNADSTVRQHTHHHCSRHQQPPSHLPTHPPLPAAFAVRSRRQRQPQLHQH